MGIIKFCKDNIEEKYDPLYITPEDGCYKATIQYKNLFLRI